MNFLKALFVADTLWSFRKGLMFVMLTFLLICLLPLFAAFSLSTVGIPGVSDTLVALDGTTNLIKLFYPNGNFYKALSIKTNWPVSGIVTLEFGQSDLPYQPLHTGIDIAGQVGEPVTPFLQGTVSYIGNLNWGYGNYVIIDHGNNLTSLYAHLSEIDVRVGQDVKPGDILGKEGQTGWATGPHVHFEIRVFGIPVNPRTFVGGNP